MANKRTPFDTLSAALSIIMCLLVSAAAVRHLTAREGPASVRPAAFQAGYDFASAAPTLHEPGRPTLLIGLSRRCRFCTASIPFYRKLLAVPAVASGQLNVSLLSLDSAAEMNDYLAEHSLQIDRRANLSETTLSIRATPVLAIISESGVVVDSWQGQIDAEGEKRVVEVLGRVLR